MSATQSSRPWARRGGISVCRAITATDAASNAAVCPRPHSAPTSEELHRLRRSLTMVDTAAR